MVYQNKIGSRIVAFIIDYLCLQILTTFLINLGVGTVYTFFGMEFAMLTYWQQILLYFIYFVGFAIFNNGITIGKLLLGLSVLQGDNEKLTDSKLIFREILKVVFMPISFISLIVILVHKENKSIHDLLIDSIVVRVRKYIPNPYNSSNPEKPKESTGMLEGFNTPIDDTFHEKPVNKEYVDPLDE